MSVLNATTRDATKPHILRRSGMVPMALIERGKDNHLIQAKADEVRLALAHAHGAGIIDLAIEGEKSHRNVIVKQVDHDAIRRVILNVTVMQVKMDDLITLDVAVHQIGVPAEVAAGNAILSQPTTHLSIRAKVSDVPNSIDVDVSGMDVNTTISASEITLAPGLELMSSADSTLFTCTLPQVQAVEETEVEVGEEPSLVGGEGGDSDSSEA